MDWGSECVYEIRRMHKESPAPAQSLPLSSRGGLSLRSSPSFWVDGKTSSLSTPHISPPDAGSSVLSLTGSSSSRAPSNESCFLESNALDEFEPPTAQESSISETKLVPFREESPKPHQHTMVSTFSLLPSLRFPSIPRQLHTPLSFSGPEHFQISDITSSELEFKLCVFLFL